MLVPTQPFGYDATKQNIYSKIVNIQKIIFDTLDDY